MFFLVGYVVFGSADAAKRALIALQRKERLEGDKEYVIMAKVREISQCFWCPSY